MRGVQKEPSHQCLCFSCDMEGYFLGSPGAREFHGSQGREIRDCPEHMNAESGPVPGTPDQVPSFLRKSKSLPGLCPTQMKCDFQTSSDF